ncbi:MULTISPECIES: hypothetical protein [unclassified Bradyrhizobium]|uniref:hypothetical protein n=1 Tax=unclassified Bradyrhizobium TaxID=2631580 RepID=UPI002916A9E7|nr:MULTISPECIES: hypothetical protein [unclassified Bradyrhizobium]
MAEKSGTPQTVLLFDQRAGSVLPYSSDAFRVSSGAKKRVLRHCAGTIVVFRNGTVARIESIQFIALWGASIWRRIFSLINGGTRRISVRMSTVSNLGFEDVRQLAAEYVGKNPKLIEHYFDKAPEIALSEVVLSSSYAELFDALGVPAPSDCLDALS